MSVPSLRLDQRAKEAFSAISPFKRGKIFSAVQLHSGLKAAEIRTGRIGFSENNPLNLVFLY